MSEVKVCYKCGLLPRAKGNAYCLPCNSVRMREHRLKNPRACCARVMKYHRTFKGRFLVLKSKTKKENNPSTDLLNNLNFYTEIIRDNECHYCLGPLGKTSHALDRMDNNIGHLCFNVVPCCKSCNQKKMNDTSYEEMMLLVPALREIRKRREEKRWQQSQ